MELETRRNLTINFDLSKRVHDEQARRYHDEDLWARRLWSTSRIRSTPNYLE